MIYFINARNIIYISYMQDIMLHENERIFAKNVLWNLFDIRKIRYKQNLKSKQ